MRGCLKTKGLLATCGSGPNVVKSSRVESGGVSRYSKFPGSDRKLFEISRVGLGHPDQARSVKTGPNLEIYGSDHKIFKSHGSGWVTVILPDPAHEM